MTFQTIKKLLDRYIAKNHPEIDLYGDEEFKELSAIHGRNYSRFLKPRPLCVFEKNIEIERENYCKANPYNKNWLKEDEESVEEAKDSKEESEEKPFKKVVRKRRTSKETITEEEQKGSKVFKCKLPGCNRQYTSSFGLKYHLKEGHSEEKLSVLKPFVCPVEDCGRKYKNNNGLKYHLKNFHDIE